MDRFPRMFARCLILAVVYSPMSLPSASEASPTSPFDMVGGACTDAWADDAGRNGRQELKSGNYGEAVLAYTKAGAALKECDERLRPGERRDHFHYRSLEMYGGAAAAASFEAPNVCHTTLLSVADDAQKLLRSRTLSAEDRRLTELLQRRARTFLTQACP